MFAYVKGTLVDASPLSVTIETHGIGYQIFIPVSVYSKLPQLGSELLLYTSTVIRENFHALYGFQSKSDKELYELLLTVSGIGPKLGLALTGHLGINELQQAIVGGDIHTLSRVPGVGKRTAERLIVELKDKLITFSPRDPSSYEDGEKPSGQSRVLRDAVSALINLGYTQAVAQKAVKKSIENSPNETALATLITSALSNV